MAGKKRAPRKIGRNADNGQFTTVEEARRKKKTHVVETLPKPKKRGGK